MWACFDDYLQFIGHELCCTYFSIGRIKSLYAFMLGKQRIQKKVRHRPKRITIETKLYLVSLYRVELVSIYFLCYSALCSDSFLYQKVYVSENFAMYA